RSCGRAFLARGAHAAHHFRHGLRAPCPRSVRGWGGGLSAQAGPPGTAGKSPRKGPAAVEEFTSGADSQENRGATRHGFVLAGSGRDRGFSSGRRAGAHHHHRTAVSIGPLAKSSRGEAGAATFPP